MSQSSERRRRFAPVPIETTFEQVRRPGPAPELTPDPSPRSASPPTPAQPPTRASSNASTASAAGAGGKREKRRFAPQLVESSRRSRRTGDVGPATRPTDKTDITPHTNHIYSLARTRSAANAKAAMQLRSRHAMNPSSARRESCDDELAGHVFDVLARENEKRLQEVALSAFPNYGARAGGAEHFFVREASEERSPAPAARPRRCRPWWGPVLEKPAGRRRRQCAGRGRRARCRGACPRRRTSGGRSRRCRSTTSS